MKVYWNEVWLLVRNIDVDDKNKIYFRNYYYLLFSGVTGTEILFGLVVTQFMVMIGQTVMVLVVAFGVFEVTCEGDLIPVTILTILTGLCGMCFGKSVFFFSVSHLEHYLTIKRYWLNYLKLFIV